MSTKPGLIGVYTLPDELKALGLVDPAWTRLEPQSLTGDPTPGLEHRIHDPLWLLGRQWQFGEFRGDDAGSPVGVRVNATARAITAWRPGDAADAAARELPPDRPLDPFVEREPPLRKVGLRMRAEAGAVLVSALSDAGFDARAALLNAYRLALDEPEPKPMSDELWKPARRFRTIARAAPDGEAAALALEAGTPAWLAGAPAAAVSAAGEWLQWYRSSVSPPAVEAPGSWIDHRLEYRFALRAGSAADGVSLEAPLHLGGSIDWYAFDQAPNTQLVVESQERDVGQPSSRTLSMLPMPLSFAGMPSDRLWQFENGNVNLGMLSVQAYDLARLCLVEFATIFGNDWFVVPLDVDVGSLTTVTELSYTNTFGERIVVAAADDRARTGRFRLFELSVAERDTTLRGLLVPPTIRGSLQSRALEEVLFLRDESANLCWALERIVQPASGDPRNRTDEPRPPRPTNIQAIPTDQLRYLLSTVVPDYWIPLLPVPTGGGGGFLLRKGSISNVDAVLGQLLMSTPFDLKDEEIPREGLRVRRVVEVARASDGVTLRWVARRVGAGRGEGSSGLAYDSAIARQPPES